MKTKIVSAALTLGLAAGSAPAAAQVGADSVEIRDVVEDYIVGWRTADEALLASAFATDQGVILWPSGDPGEETLNGMTFGDVLARGRRPNPAYGERWRILALDIVDGELAVAKIDISREGGSYVDYLVLYKLGGGWRIVAKTYVVR